MKTTDPKKLEAYRENKDYIVSTSGSVYDNREISVSKEILTNLYSERKRNKNRHLAIEMKFSKLKK